MSTFPDNFLWGAATSSHQVEGNNYHNDWWHYEQSGRLKTPSGEACRHYELYELDFDLAKSLHHNAHRFSIEWSRIEKREGEFSPEELRHYKNVIRALRSRGIEPIVTLHHFTNPFWFLRKGGWLRQDSHRLFCRYVSYVVSELSEDVKYWITINEPLVYAYHSYLLGAWPPQERSFIKTKKVCDNLFRAHICSYRLMRELYRKKNLPAACVSIAKNVQFFNACKPGIRNNLAVGLRDRFFNTGFIRGLVRNKSLDFIGINYYTRNTAHVKRWKLNNLLIDTCEHDKPLDVNSLGWEIFPEGLYYFLTRLKRFGLPLMVLENGICTDDDNQRLLFIREHLKQLHRAITDKAPVLGYIHWSLIDNFEWDKGFKPRFGLIGIDYSTFERNVRDSAQEFAEVCASNTLKDD